MSAASPRDLPGRGHGSRAEPEVKSGSHSIPAARVNDAVSHVTNLLQGKGAEKSTIDIVSLDPVLHGILARTVEAVFLSKVSDKLTSEEGALADLKTQANNIKLELDNENIPSYHSFFPSKSAISFAAENFHRLASSGIATLNREAFHSVLQVTMQPLFGFFVSRFERLKRRPDILKKVLINIEYTTRVVAELIKRRSIALRRPTASAQITPAPSAPKAADSSQSQPAEGVFPIPRNDIGTSVRSIADNVIAKWPIRVVASTRAYYEDHKDKESQLTANTKLKNLVAVKINDVSAGYQDLQQAFNKVGGHLPATEMISPETVLTLAARIVRTVPVTNADSDIALDTQIAACVDKAMDHFSKQIQANLPADKFTELQRSIAVFLVRLRVNYAHTLAIAVRAFMLSKQKTDSLTRIASESLSVALNAPHQLNMAAAVVGDGIVTASASGVPQQHNEQSQKTVASRGLVSDTRKSFRNTLLAAAMSAVSGIKDLSSSSAPPLNQDVPHSQPATTVAPARQNPNPTPAPRPVPRQVQENVEVGQITGTVEIPVAGTIQGAINTALHQLNVDSAARTANEPRNALALWALRSHGVVLNNTQINLLINALTSRIADTEMHAGSHDSPKRAWHAGMPNSTRLRLTYTLGREPSFTVTLLENNARRAERGSVTAAFSVTPQMLIEGRAWEVATRTSPPNTLITQNPYDPPHVPIFKL